VSTVQKGTQTAQALGDPAIGSKYAEDSYLMAVTVNLGVKWTLDFLELITLFPPTKCDASSCTWGPWVDNQGLNTWKFEVSKAGSGFQYALSGQPGSNKQLAFAPIVSGVAYPGADRDHGSGTFTVDFDAEAALDHGPLWTQDSFGILDVDYDNTHPALSIHCTFMGAKDRADGRAMNARYEFDGSSAGGTLQVGFRKASPDAQARIRTRWTTGGAGRADVAIDLSDGQTYTFTGNDSECWMGAPTYALTYSLGQSLNDQSWCDPLFQTADPPDVVVPALP
jgi:hypothetical protein